MLSPHFAPMEQGGKKVGYTLRFRTLIIAIVPVVLAGCSAGAGLLDGKAGVPRASAVPVGNNLALPPDLQLATPGPTSDAYSPNGGVAPVIATPTSKTNKKTGSANAQVASAPGGDNSFYGAAGKTVAASQGDIFDQYGISKIGADGKAKTPQQLSDELNAAMTAKRRLTNPKYGTIGNIGSIFSQ